MNSEFHYQIHWRAHGGHPGYHLGSQSGGGEEFHGYVPFSSQPDPRHLDIRAMLADPLQQLMVKSFRQRAAVPIYLLADLSGSMGFRGKTALLAEFAEAAAWSAWRTGDPFGLFACDNDILWDLSLPLHWHKGLAADVRSRVESFQPKPSAAIGLLDAAAQLGRQRALVFLASDFHLPMAFLDNVFQALSRHELVPVILWDSGEYTHLPRWGLAELQDPETGQRRRLFLRPGVNDKLAECFAHRRDILAEFCARHGREPFFLVDRFDPDAMTRYFYPA